MPADTVCAWRSKANARRAGRTNGSISLSYIGSSLGGYYATYLAEKFRLRGIVDPSVKRYGTFRAHLGKNKFYFDEGGWEFDETHIQQLKR